MPSEEESKKFPLQSMRGQNILWVLGCLLVAYHVFLPPAQDVKSFKWTQPFTVPLKAGDQSTQNEYIWNFMAPLGNDVAERIRRRDLREIAEISGDISEYPRSLLLHEADVFPENITFFKLIYQVLLLLTGSLILKLYVVPLFRIN